MPEKRHESGTRPVQRRLLILCEGAKDKSENAYFKALIKDRRNPNNRIEVKVIDTKKNTAKELVQEAKKHREFNGDELWSCSIKMAIPSMLRLSTVRERTT